MNDDTPRNDARLNLWWPHWMADAVKRGANRRALSKNDYVRDAVFDKLKSDGVMTDAA